MNDFPSCMKDGIQLMYADDIDHKNNLKSNEKVTHIIERFVEWCNYANYYQSLKLM